MSWADDITTKQIAYIQVLASRCGDEKFYDLVLSRNFSGLSQGEASDIIEDIQENILGGAKIIIKNLPKGE